MDGSLPSPESRVPTPRVSCHCLTGGVIETGLVQNAGEELQPNDCVDYHHEQHEEHYVGEGDHGHEDTVQHNLETCKQNAHGV